MRAQTGGEQPSSAAELSRRQLMHGGLALSAAAGLLPLAAPRPALANNKVLSADWEKVSRRTARVSARVTGCLSWHPTRA